MQLSPKSHNFNIWQKIITHSNTANIIAQVHKLSKHNRKKSDVTTNFLTFTVSIQKCPNKKYKNIYMTLNSSSTNTKSYTTTDDVHAELADITENNLLTIQKMIKNQLQTMPLMMMINHLKQQEKIFIVSFHQAPNHL